MSSAASARPRVLFVDDDELLLEAFVDSLRRNFDVVTATGGSEGLSRLETHGPFAVVVSDMRMPGLNGAGFLSFVQMRSPATVRILLTGQADVESAIAAVNQGHVFRFLTKPCSRETLLQALVAAVRQHRLAAEEQTILEETLNGSMRALVDVLSLAQPEAFGRARRLSRAAAELAAAAGVADAWQVELAAMLSQIGCLTLPEETAERYYYGEPLDDAERVLVERLPAVAARLIRDIPRIEGVYTALVDQNTRPGEAGEVGTGARILKIVHDFDLLTATGMSEDLAVAHLRGRGGEYDAELLETFSAARGTNNDITVRAVPLGRVEAGMTFASDVRAPGGGTLIAREQEVTAALLERIANLPVAVRAQTVSVVDYGDGDTPD